MEIIDGLLRIKRIREDSREAEMRLARQQLERAAEALREATEAQQRRDRERTEREQSMYRDVCSRVVVVRELDDLRHEVDAMKEAGKVDAKAVVDAQAKRQERRQSFDEATGAWRLAMQATQKFEDLSAEEREARARHMEWLADLEMEEHSGRSAVSRAMEEETEEA
jgi:type III secretion protein O